MEAVGNTRAYVLAIVVVPVLGDGVGNGAALATSGPVIRPGVTLVMYTVTCFGLTIGFHRMLTHRSFRSHPAMKFLLLVLVPWHSSDPDRMGGDAPEHHSQSDREGDPHSPTEGLFHSHIGWLFKGPLR